MLRQIQLGLIYPNTELLEQVNLHLIVQLLEMEIKFPLHLREKDDCIVSPSYTNV